jgi:hypothetical protein
MYKTIAASIALLGTVAIASPGQAAPVAVDGLNQAQNAPIVQVRDGCGPGWHRVGWQDRWGRWRSRCVPNRRW